MHIDVFALFNWTPCVATSSNANNVKTHVLQSPNVAPPPAFSLPVGQFELPLGQR